MIAFDVLTFEPSTALEYLNLPDYLEELEEAFAAALIAQQNFRSTAYDVRQTSQDAAEVMSQFIDKLADVIIAMDREITRVKVALGHDDNPNGIY